MKKFLKLEKTNKISNLIIYFQFKFIAIKQTIMEWKILEILKITNILKDTEEGV